MKDGLKTFVVVVSMLAGCVAEDDEPLLWGDVTLALGGMYCEALSRCGWYFSNDDGVNICAEHISFHLCESDRSCEREVTHPELAARRLENCDERLHELDPDTTPSDCYFLKTYGIIPHVCHTILELKPEAPDAGPE